MIVGIFRVVGLCTCTQKNLMVYCISLLGVGTRQVHLQLL